MPSVEYADTPRELRGFAILQWLLTAGFLVLLYWMLGGTDADFPPYWLAGLLLVLVVCGTILAERAWLSMRALPSNIAESEAQSAAIGLFAKLTVRKLIFCEIPLLVAVFVAFVSPYAAWPLVIAGFPGLLVLAWETWPSLRNTSMAAAMLEASGAESGLVQSFLRP
jgi:hypothetical protein